MILCIKGGGGGDNFTCNFKSCIKNSRKKYFERIFLNKIAFFFLLVNTFFIITVQIMSKSICVVLEE